MVKCRETTKKKKNLFQTSPNHFIHHMWSKLSRSWIRCNMVVQYCGLGEGLLSTFQQAQLTISSLLYEGYCEDRVTSASGQTSWEDLEWAPPLKTWLKESNVRSKCPEKVCFLICPLCCHLTAFNLLATSGQHLRWRQYLWWGTHTWRLVVLRVQGSRILPSITGSWLVLCQHPPVCWSMTKNKPNVWAWQTSWAAPWENLRIDMKLTDVLVM